jgi:hypothetical protein
VLSEVGYSEIEELGFRPWIEAALEIEENDTRVALGVIRNKCFGNDLIANFWVGKMTEESAQQRGEGWEVSKLRVKCSGASDGAEGQQWLGDSSSPLSSLE